jgi:hypothetical protein
MTSFRIHAVDPDRRQPLEQDGPARQTAHPPTEEIPYLVLELRAGSRVTLDLQGLERGSSPKVPPIALSTAAVYELLQGNDVQIVRPEGNVSLVPGKDDLLIFCEAGDDRLTRKYRVWLSELGVAWNMLCSAEYLT